jgi:MFS family permease
MGSLASPPVNPPPTAPAPLLPALVFTALNSATTGLVSTAIFFVVEQGYGFRLIESYGLGFLLGIGYIVGALFSGPLVARLKQRFAKLSARRVLGVLLFAMAALCTLPVIFPGPLSVWVLVGLYSPLMGAFWPIVESYVSGGRRGADLRRTVGIWSVTWSGALVPAVCLIAPFCKSEPALSLLMLGVVQVVSALALARFPAEPPQHLDEESHAHPVEYRQLLAIFRCLLPLSSLLLNTLGPYLPGAFARLGAPASIGAALVAIWLLPRALSFYVLAHSERWQGRWSMAVQAALALVGGFTLSILASRLDDGALGWALQVGGLVLYGVGMAMVYSGSFYYAMEVGHAGIDAGGKHEALIGVGFAVGPLIGFLASGAVELEALSRASFEPVLLFGIYLALLAGIGLAWWQVRRLRGANPD